MNNLKVKANFQNPIYSRQKYDQKEKPKTPKN